MPKDVKKQDMSKFNFLMKQANKFQHLRTNAKKICLMTKVEEWIDSNIIEPYWNKRAELGEDKTSICAQNFLVMKKRFNMNMKMRIAGFSVEKEN